MSLDVIAEPTRHALLTAGLDDHDMACIDVATAELAGAPDRIAGFDRDLARLEAP